MTRVAVTPSPTLAAWLQAQLASAAPSDLGAWPQRVGRRANAVLVHALESGALMWFVALDGALLELDTDDVQQRLEPVTDAATYARVIGLASVRYPQLAELLHAR